MKTIKRVLALTLILFMIGGCVACNDETPPNTDVDTTTPSTEADTPSSGTTEPETNAEDTAKDPFENATDVRVMSFNIRVGEQTDVRHEAVLQQIRDVSPDVFGVQEANSPWINYLSAQLTDYTLVGEGRDGGTNGEYAAIYYRTDKYTLIQGGTRWLSLSPDTPSILAGGSQYRRVLTYAKLKDNQTGAIFVHINVHLDYSSDDIARQQINIVAEYARLFRDYPVFITGDCNQTPDSQMYAYITGAGYLDSALTADSANVVGTFNDYNRREEKHLRLDYCFVSPDNIRLSKYKTCNNRASNAGYHGFISDHYAIYVDAKIINSDKVTDKAEELNQTVFQCGDRIYGDLSFNTYDHEGVICRYDNRVLTLEVGAGHTLELAGITTAEDISLCLTGEGSIAINGDISTYKLQTTDTVTVTVHGAVTAFETTYGANTTVIADPNTDSVTDTAAP